MTGCFDPVAQSQEGSETSSESTGTASLSSADASTESTESTSSESTEDSSSSSSSGVPGDEDGDGIADDLDNCPALANPEQDDVDGDRIGDGCDNCTDVHNTDQGDLDEDGIGNFCDAEAIDTPEIFYVPSEQVLALQGSRCVTGEVRIYGTVNLAAYDGEDRNGLRITSLGDLWLGSSAVVDGTGAGFPGGSTSAAGGGLAGGGLGFGCGGGPGSCVGQGGSGGGYGGPGGTPETATGFAEPCDYCNEATIPHCYGTPGSTNGTPEGLDLSMGSGGGSAGNSCGCTDSEAFGSRGGGLVQLVAAGRAVLDGRIAVNGAIPPLDPSICGYRPGGGGGSGGGILVAASEIAGTGVLEAEGGPGGEALGDASSTWGWAGGGGGGGRIKLFGADAFEGVVHAAGGPGGVAPADDEFSFAGLPGGDGTVARGLDLPSELVPEACP